MNSAVAILCGKFLHQYGAGLKSEAMEPGCPNWNLPLGDTEHWINYLSQFSHLYNRDDEKTCLMGLLELNKLIHLK